MGSAKRRRREEAIIAYLKMALDREAWPSEVSAYYGWPLHRTAGDFRRMARKGLIGRRGWSRYVPEEVD